jgi:hypothetical protein
MKSWTNSWVGDVVMLGAVAATVSIALNYSVGANSHEMFSVGGGIILALLVKALFERANAEWAKGELKVVPVLMWLAAIFCGLALIHLASS